jgi:hypothetical protein
MDILKRTEAVPSNYPSVPSGLSAEAAALDSDMLFQRIESYIAHRWTDREVVWIIEGPGDWQPDLTPATLTATEIWESNAWAAVTLEASALGGLCLASDGLYRFTADVGSGTVPAMVNEAFKRLAEYSASDPGTHGSSDFKVGAGSIELEFQRSPTWLARAMQYSGAADLLRQYRRA